ncbi:MAG: M48 family metallopeptidase [Anaerovoracaceae bacterium]
MDYRLIRTKRTTMAIYVRPGGSVEVRAPISAEQEDIDAFVDAKKIWIRKNLDRVEELRTAMEEVTIPKTQLSRHKGRLEHILKERCQYFASRMGVDYGKIRINRARTRWASCNGKGDLNFSLAMMALPRELVDYIVVHELSHRKEMNHSKGFWAIVEKEMPDYRERRKRLKNYLLTK